MPGGAVYEQLDKYLADCAKEVHEHVSKLDEAISEELFGDNKTTDPRKEKHYKKALKARTDFLEKSKIGEAAARVYEERVKDSVAKLSSNVEKLFDENFACDATHPGKAPEEYLFPMCVRDDQYRKSVPEMLTREQLLDNKELQKPKFLRENDLYCRECNLTNHSFVHTCSDYCWREESLELKYDPDVHKEGQNGVVKIFTTPEGDARVKLVVKVCRMGFGYRAQYPKEDGGRTGGAERIDKATLVPDNNGQLRFKGQRNHPQKVQEPVAMLHWASNADMQFFMNNAETFKMCQEAKIPYCEFVNNMYVSQMSGLEEFSASNSSICYGVGYACKGHQCTNEWCKKMQACAETMANEDENKSARSFVATHMKEIAGSRSVPRDEACYIVAGGDYSQNTRIVKECSVHSINLTEIQEVQKVEDASNEGKTRKQSTTFTMSNISNSYYDRSSSDFNTTIYLHAAKVFKCVPNFFGFYTSPKWPLTEDYAKIMLFLHCPHQRPLSRLKTDDSHVQYLLDYMEREDTLFPKELMVKIMRSQHSWKIENPDVELGEGGWMSHQQRKVKESA